MFQVIDYFLNKYRPFLQVFALGMFVFASSLIYFLRDGIGLAKGSSVFTMALTLGPMLAIFPFLPFKKIYRPNVAAYVLAGTFLLMCFLYLLVYAPNRGWFTNTFYEIAVMGIIAFLYFYLTTVSYENLNKYFVETAIIITGLGSFFFVIYLLRNPAFVLGTRASINFGNSETESTGNPHIYAKVAYLGLVASVFYMRRAKGIVLQLINVGHIILQLAVLVLTQSMATVLTLFIFIFLYGIFNVTLVKVVLFLRRLFLNPSFWVFFLGIVYKIYDFYVYHIGEITNVITANSKRIEVLIETFVPSFFQSSNKKVVFTQRVDMSAASRLDNLAVIQKTLEDHWEDGNILPILFGNGYHKLYVDVPILEPFHSFGIVGFIVFLSFFVYINILVYREMKNPTSFATEYIAYAYLYFFVLTFTGGFIVDYIRWGFFALVCRFLYFSRKKAKIRSASTN